MYMYGGTKVTHIIAADADSGSSKIEKAKKAGVTIVDASWFSVF
jgi:NAD-dependent DNA ligase